jgi:hypothetical protein
VVIKGLTSANDEAFCLPNVGIVFSEPRANRIVRLDEHPQTDDERQHTQEMPV